MSKGWWVKGTGGVPHLHRAGSFKRLQRGESGLLVAKKCCVLGPLLTYLLLLVFLEGVGKAAAWTSALEHTSSVLRGCSLRFFFPSLLGREVCLLDAHPPRCAEFGEGVRKRRRASLWAPRSARGRSEFGLLRPSPSLSLPSPPFPAPLQSIRILWLQYACARSAAG